MTNKRLFILKYIVNYQYDCTVLTDASTYNVCNYSQAKYQCQITSTETNDGRPPLLAVLTRSIPFGLFSIDFFERTRWRHSVFVQKRKRKWRERSLIRRTKTQTKRRLFLFFIRFLTRTLEVQWLISPRDGGWAEARTWCQKKISGTADSSWRPYNTVLGRCV